jgi:hypothetical protein
MLCCGNTSQRDASDRASQRDASTVRLMKSLELFLCEKSLARKDGSPEGLYSREGDA